MAINESLILVYVLVAINFLFNKLKDFSCHVQNIASDSLLVKHGLNLIGVFFVIVIFTRSTPIKPVLLVMVTFLMYGFFILITRCDYRFLFLFLAIMVLVMYLEAEKSYSKSLIRKNESIDVKKEEEYIRKYSLAQNVLHICSVTVVLIGVIVYIGSHSREYRREWSWFKFWWGSKACKGNGTPIKKSLMMDFVEGLKRLTKD